jgi:hypothetical protein
MKLEVGVKMGGGWWWQVVGGMKMGVELSGEGGV